MEKIIKKMIENCSSYDEQEKINNLLVKYYNINPLSSIEILAGNKIVINTFDERAEKSTTRTYTFKKIDLQKIIEKIRKQESLTYPSCFLNLTKIINKKMRGLGSYPASYGIGIDNLFGLNENKKIKLRKFLKENNIKYNEVLSNAGWVTRFEISKSKENLNKINSLKSLSATL